VTLRRFVVRNMWRNKRRSVLTILSLAFSLLLLSLMASIWRSFYYQDWTVGSATRLVCRHRVSFFAAMPGFYREKIRALPGVVKVVPMNQFGGLYKDEQEFLQIGTDPNEYFEVYNDYGIPEDQLKAWQADPTGALADSELAQRMGWKIGERIVVQGLKFPVNLELTLRGIVKGSFPADVIYFNWKYAQEATGYDKAEVFLVRVDSAKNIGRIALAIDDMFRNSTAPTRTESEHAFDVDMVSTLGNVKLFILSVCAAVLFSSLLVAANTIAMSIRERTREVAVLRTLGFTPQTILAMFMAEAVGLCVTGWLLASLAAYAMVSAIAHTQRGVMFAVFLKASVPAVVLPLLAAVFVGSMSAAFPAYRASRMNIVDALRHVG
jgi:putative ABC transport system permease protein